jgi:hypothetical protein
MTTHVSEGESGLAKAYQAIREVAARASDESLEIVDHRFFFPFLVTMGFVSGFYKEFEATIPTSLAIWILAFRNSKEYKAGDSKKDK